MPGSKARHTDTHGANPMSAYRSMPAESATQ